jgi:hypothetical protein
MPATLTKPSREERKRATRTRRRERRETERAEKQIVRHRDQYRCRMPLCGCRDAGMRLEVSHQRHKGMGGNPKGDRSTQDQMILLCRVRHQQGIISRHKGSLAIRPLTDAGTAGPCAFAIDVWALMRAWPVRERSLAFKLALADAVRAQERGGMVELVREYEIHRWLTPEAWQREILHRLGEMRA